MKSFFYVLFVSLFIVYVQGQFDVPDALVEPLSPKGFRVSIPDAQGIKLFAFHGKLNEELEGREGGTFSRDVIKAKGGRWTYVDKTTKLKVGDVLYYWTYVDWFDGERKLGYTKDDQSFTVRELIPDSSVTNKPTTARPMVTRPGTDNCATTKTTLKDRSTCSGRLIFQENFSNNFFNDAARKWEVEEEFADSPDYEFVLYTQDSRNIYTNRNILYIKPTPIERKYGQNIVTDPEGLDLGTNCTSTAGSVRCTQKPQSYLILPPVVSARINTKDSFWFTYGTVEIRAKLPKGAWVYPELFLNPKGREYGRGYDSGQIRIAFVPGNYDLNKNLTAGVVLGSSSYGRNFGMRSQERANGWSDDYHVYSVKWEPNRISLLVDGEIYDTIDPPLGGFAEHAKDLKITNDVVNRWRSGSKMAPFDQSMYITIGVGVGGHSFPDDLPNKPWKNNDPKGQKNFHRAKDQWFATWGSETMLHVDYVRVYAL